MRCRSGVGPVGNLFAEDEDVFGPDPLTAFVKKFVRLG